MGKHGINISAGESPDCPDSGSEVVHWGEMLQRGWKIFEQEGTFGGGWVVVSQADGCVLQLDVAMEGKQGLISKEVGGMAGEEEVGGAKN